LYRVPADGLLIIKPAGMMLFYTGADSRERTYKLKPTCVARVSSLNVCAANNVAILLVLFGVRSSPPTELTGPVTRKVKGPHDCGIRQREIFIKKSAVECHNISAGSVSLSFDVHYANDFLNVSMLVETAIRISFLCKMKIEKMSKFLKDLVMRLFPRTAFKTPCKY
jgi:hypothetical protein